MTEDETLCDRTYRAHERQESKPDKPETRSLPRHTKQDHKVRIEPYFSFKFRCV